MLRGTRSNQSQPLDTVSYMASENAPNSPTDQAGAAPADPPDRPEVSSGPESSGTATGTDSTGPAGTGTGDEWDEEDSILTWKLLAAVAVVLGVLFVGAYFLFNNNKKDKDNVASTGSTSPASTASPAVPTVRDAFDRPDNKELGKAGTGEDWQAPIGTWGIKGKQAYVVDRNKSGPRNVAVLDTGFADGSVSAKSPTLVDGWGLVFRYRGPNAYWYIQWNAQFKAFHVFKVQDGKVTEVVKGGVPVQGAKDGMVAKVEYSGQAITLFADGKPLETVNDQYLKGETKAGLFVTDKGADTARWADFVAQKGLNGPPLTAPPDPNAKPKAGGAQAGNQPKAGAKAQQPAAGGKGPTTTPGGATPPTS